MLPRNRCYHDRAMLRAYHQRWVGGGIRRQPQRVGLFSVQSGCDWIHQITGERTRNHRRISELYHSGHVRKSYSKPIATKPDRLYAFTYPNWPVGRSDRKRSLGVLACERGVLLFHRSDLRYFRGEDNVLNATAHCGAESPLVGRVDRSFADDRKALQTKCCIAVPMFDPSGKTIATISLS